MKVKSWFGIPYGEWRDGVSPVPHDQVAIQLDDGTSIVLTDRSSAGGGLVIESSVEDTAIFLTAPHITVRKRG